jgi:hypothetical protein
MPVPAFMPPTVKSIPPSSARSKYTHQHEQSMATKNYCETDNIVLLVPLHVSRSSLHSLVRPWSSQLILCGPCNVIELDIVPLRGLNRLEVALMFSHLVSTFYLCRGNSSGC